MTNRRMSQVNTNSLTALTTEQGGAEWQALALGWLGRATLNFSCYGWLLSFIASEAVEGTKQRGQQVNTQGCGDREALGERGGTARREDAGRRVPGRRGWRGGDAGPELGAGGGHSEGPARCGEVA